MPNHFTLKKTVGKARVGSFHTEHGTFETPNFMPVGTQATVKGVAVDRLEQMGAQITLVNTYHLWLRPGPELIERYGGVHRFCGWAGPILSDSGGFQIFSLQGIRTVTEEGVEFRSHIDGARMFLTPEKSIAIQQALGVDIAMALDECPPGDWPREKIARSLEMTHRWAKRSLESRTREETRIFGITQGGCDRELRTTSAQALSELPFDGYAVGGLSVGEPKPNMYEVLSYHPEQLPNDSIRYLMGVGTPEDIVEAVANGIDLFDCVMPTRSGRFGRAFVSGPEVQINIKNAKHREVDAPLDDNCRCLACSRYSRAYIHHLFRVDEMLGPQLMSIHNLSFYLALMEQIRDAIRGDTFDELYRAEKARWRALEGKSHDTNDAELVSS